MRETTTRPEYAGAARCTALLGLGAIALATIFTAGCGGDPAARAAAEATEQWAMLDRYCVECHNDAEYTGDVSFESWSPENIAAHAATFEKVVRKLRGQLMPPPGEPRPDAEARYSFISWLESSLDETQGQEHLADEGVLVLADSHPWNPPVYCVGLDDFESAWRVAKKRGPPWAAALYRPG